MGGGFAAGGDFMVDRPAFFLAGEVPERVQITPQNAQHTPQGGDTYYVKVEIPITTMDGRDVDKTIRDKGRRAIADVMRELSGGRNAVIERDGIFDRGRV